MEENKEEILEIEENNEGIKISNDVVAVIAGVAVSEVPGVASMSGGFAGGISEVLSGKKNMSKGIKVESDEKEVKIDGVVNYGNYYALEDLLIIERNIASEPGNSIVVYDKNGVQKASYSEFGFVLCPSNYGFNKDCYDFKVEDNKIKYTIVVDAQDASTICGEYKDKESFMEYEVEYSNDTLSKPKKIKSLTGKQLIDNNKVKCN